DARTLYTASQYFDAQNAASIPSWTRFDLGARYITRVAGKDVTFRARIDNVSDRAYWAAAGGYPGSSYLVQGAPRTAMLSA
ncbi:TonB-dependent receptor, partial [Salmonella enterica subsp. enterica serovar Typhimurium]